METWHRPCFWSERHCHSDETSLVAAVRVENKKNVFAADEASVVEWEFKKSSYQNRNICFPLNIAPKIILGILWFCGPQVFTGPKKVEDRSYFSTLLDALGISSKGAPVQRFNPWTVQNETPWGYQHIASPTWFAGNYFINIFFWNPTQK